MPAGPTTIDNFLREPFEAVRRILREPGPAPVLLLSGEPGSGRAAVLDAAAERVLRLDLEGFEEGPEGLVGFLSLWGQRHEAETDEARAERLERVAELAAEIQPSAAGAVLLALLLEKEEPLRELPEPAEDPREGVRRLLERWSGAGRLVLHIADSALLDALTRRWLLDEARRHPDLVLAFSCHPNDSDAAVAPGAEALRLDFARPPTDAEVHLEPVRDLLSRVDLQAADLLGRFLDLAALCGRNIPSDLLMAHLDVTTEQREELLDLIDDALVEEGDERLFFDHEYGHPSFAGLLVYSFLSPAFNQDLLEPVPREKRKRLAAGLLSFLRQRVPVATRGLARLFLSLAEHTEDPRERKPFRRLLDWWISPGRPEDLEGLTSVVAGDLEAGRVQPEEVLEIADRSAGIWAPPQRLALLAALARSASLSRSAQADTHYLRAGLLREAGQPAEALQEARLALDAAAEVHGRSSAPYGAILTLTGALAGDAGDFDRARADFQESLDVHRRAFGDRHPSVAASLANLAALHRHLGDTQRARELFDQSFAIARDAQGEDHPFTQALLNARNELAG
jgi:tetratricopeptide (TPR) repeat protein